VPPPGSVRIHGRIVAVELDEVSIAAPRPRGFGEEERTSAIHDLVADNVFDPPGRAGGDYRLRLSVEDGKLVFAVSDRAGAPVGRHILSLTPLRRVMKDYLLICDSYYAALGAGGPAQIEAIDMGRRGVHNEGSEILRRRLAGKVAVDLATARRLFTLVCALAWKV
jgi:uncharacterized protein (UPF0262 family)